MFERLRQSLRSRFKGADALPDEHAGAIAAAMLLLEVAWADQDIQEVELERVRAALCQIFGLGAHESSALVAEARAAHASSISMYPFTRTANEGLSFDEKKALLVNCWRLANADAVVDEHEEHAIRRIAELLYLSHEDFIAAKLEARRAGD
jgi:uncharacterized tellurite resistance protein B-like protein